MVIALPPEKLDAAHDKHLLKLKHKFQNNLYLFVKHNYYGDDFRRIYALTARAKQAGISIVATNDVHYHVPERRRLHDVLSCIREHCPLSEAGYRLMVNSAVCYCIGNCRRGARHGQNHQENRRRALSPGARACRLG